MTLPTPSGRWTTTARPAFAVAAALSLGGNLLSLWIGSWKSSDLPADAGYAGVLEGGWEHMLNQPTYFTFLSNFLVGLTSLLLALRLHRPGTLFRVLRVTGVVCIVITGVVFNVLLRDADPMTAVERFNDTLQHIVTPILTPVLWAVFGPRRQITWRVVWLSTLIPLAWLAFTLLRGPWLDWYRTRSWTSRGWATTASPSTWWRSSCSSWRSPPCCGWPTACWRGPASGWGRAPRRRPGWRPVPPLTPPQSDAARPTCTAHARTSASATSCWSRCTLWPAASSAA